MQNPNLPPGAQPVAAGGQPPPKLTREQKRALAEQKKRIEQEKMRAMELSKLVSNLHSELEHSVIDPPMMYKLAANRLKLMLKADHIAVAMFEAHPQMGDICIVRQQSNLPPKPVVEKQEEVKVKRVMVNGEVMEIREKIEKEDDQPKLLYHKPFPKDTPKGGQLPDLEEVLLHAQPPAPQAPLTPPPALFDSIEQARTSRQPLMAPDVSKFSDPALVAFAAGYGIKSVLLVPIVVHEQVDAVMLLFTVNNPQGYAPVELHHMQKAIEILARSIETAPPVLPEKIKERVIGPMTKGDNVPKQIEYYSDFFDNVFAFMIGELEEEEALDIKMLQAEQEKTPNRLRKVWYQIGKALEFKDRPRFAYLFNIGMNEMVDQAMEYADSKKLNKPRGLKPFQELMNKIVKKPNMRDIFKDDAEADGNKKERQYIMVGTEVMAVSTDEGQLNEMGEELMAEVDKEVTKAVRGSLLFSEQKRATLINDIEQSEMLVNFISVTAALDFKQHIRASLPDMHDDIDQHSLLAELCHHGMREISKVVAQNIAEKHLYELEDFLEQSEEWQKDKLEKLEQYIHYRIMANLVETLRANEPTLWAGLIQDRIRKRSQKAAKQRAVLVGRMVRAASADAEDEDWDEEEEDEDE